jgi:hypothetical protein
LRVAGQNNGGGGRSVRFVAAGGVLARHTRNVMPMVFVTGARPAIRQTVAREASSACPGGLSARNAADSGPLSAHQSGCALAIDSVHAIHSELVSVHVMVMVMMPVVVTVPLRHVLSVHHAAHTDTRVRGQSVVGVVVQSIVVILVCDLLHAVVALVMAAVMTARVVWATLFPAGKG